MSSLSLTEGDLDEPILNDERLFLRFSLCFSIIEAISSSVTETRLLPVSFRVRLRSAVFSVEVDISTCDPRVANLSGNCTSALSNWFQTKSAKSKMQTSSSIIASRVMKKLISQRRVWFKFCCVPLARSKYMPIAVAAFYSHVDHQVLREKQWLA